MKRDKESVMKRDKESVMKRDKHVILLSRSPQVAQSNFQIKMESITTIIDRLLLVPRQSPWKATPGDGTDTTDTTTDTTTDDVTGLL